uniref:Odorant receptor n=1 Tax=Lutzomyia longipalpis TaxID=7200 RepID=A0A1B0GLR5_LUTLO
MRNIRETGLRKNLITLWLFLSLLCGITTTIDLFLYIVLKPRNAISIWEILTQLFIGMYFISAMLKTVVVVFHKDKIEKLLKWFDDNWPDGRDESENEDIVEGYMRNNTWWMSHYVYISFASYITVNLSPVLTMAIRYLSTGNLKFLVPFNTWLQYSHPGSFEYPFVYTYLIYGSHVASASSICFDTMFCIIICHICMHFKVLQEKVITSVVPEANSSPEICEKILKECIVKQQKLIELTNVLGSLFNEVIFFNFTASSFNMCVDGFLFVMQPGLGKIRFVMMFLTLMSQIFILCWYGQELINNSLSISDAAYNCLWYESTQKFRKMILHIIHNSQKPQKIIAVKFWEVSLKSFSKLIQASWSYFALLNTVFGDWSFLAPAEGGLLT